MSRTTIRLTHNSCTLPCWAGLMIAALAALLSVVACRAPSPTTAPVSATVDLPSGSTLESTRTLSDFDGLPLTTLSGDEASLSDYQGRVIVINFWATWCGPCLIEMPELQAYYDAHQAEGLVLLAVNRQETPAQAAAFIQEQGYTFPVLLDQTGRVYESFLLRTMPATVVFDANGRLIWQYNGLLNQALLEEQVSPLLLAN